MAERDLGADATLTRDMGARLRRAREQQGVSLRSLALGIDVSPSLLSQIENGLARPSVGTLWALVSELGISLDTVVYGSVARAGPGDPAEPVIQRAGQRQVLELSGGVTWEQLNAPHDSDVVFTFVTYEPGVESEGRTVARHSGREYGFLVSGRLAIEIDDRRLQLGPGDAISFDSRQPHRFSAVGADIARAVWFNVAR